ncbi:hypothetical protein [Catellatospora tritici]|uniref:hypothetical protein n=1 Tax=Catellatospora tritici TaxID=2851566 RepID=UPI001C2CD5A0|nr:hypothetical protein [Catellatospora tritici]MBV1853553.1 hypothetical protein [Catellatospora tritici]
MSQDPTHRAVQKWIPEGDPDWEDCATRVIVMGAPNYLREAGRLYSDLLFNLRFFIDDMRNDLDVVKAKWTGTAADRFRDKTLQIIAALEHIDEKMIGYSGIKPSLELAADQLQHAQREMPVPEDVAQAIVESHNMVVNGIWTGVDEGAFRSALSELDQGFFADVASDIFDSPEGDAQDRYNDLNHQYVVTASGMPEGFAPRTVGFTDPRDIHDPVLLPPGSGSGLRDGFEAPPADVPKPPNLKTGRGGGGLGGVGGVGSLAGAGGFPPTGTAFGKPVATGAWPSGFAGGALSAGFGAPGGGAGGLGATGTEFTTDLVEDDDPWRDLGEASDDVMR